MQEILGATQCDIFDAHSRRVRLFRCAESKVHSPRRVSRRRLAAWEEIESADNHKYRHSRQDQRKVEAPAVRYGCIGNLDVRLFVHDSPRKFRTFRDAWGRL